MKSLGLLSVIFFSRWKGVTASVEVSRFHCTAQIQQCHFKLIRVRRCYSSKNNEVWQVLGLGKEEKLRRMTCKSTFFAGIPTSRIDQWIESNFYGTEELCRIYKENYEGNFRGCWTTEIENYGNSLKFVRGTHIHNAEAKWPAAGQSFQYTNWPAVLHIWLFEESKEPKSNEPSYSCRLSSDMRSKTQINDLTLGLSWAQSTEL